MKKSEFVNDQETLDPADWERMRVLGHRMLDDMFDEMQTIRERPVWQHAPEQIKSHFQQKLPLDPQLPEEIYQEFLDYILPYPAGNSHPRFWGWVLGPGMSFGVLAEMLTATMNIGSSGSMAFNPGNYVEHQVLDWFKEMLGFPAQASGILTSGCSAANLIGLAVARNSKAENSVRQVGLQGHGPKMVLYASKQIHSSIQKAVELLGLGSDALRIINFDNKFRIKIEELIDSINRDRENGLLPFCVVGAAGTTDTGAVDDLNALADICEREGLWFHVDGAFGAWAAITPDNREIVSGIERADSLAFDLHKWMYMQYELGCILVRNEELHRGTFALTPIYLDHGIGERGMTARDTHWMSDYGFQLSRGFRALKAWMAIKEHGALKFGRMIQKNIDQARYLGELVETHPKLELVTPIALNVVCFRYVGEILDEEKIDQLNKGLVIELQESGVVVVSGSRIDGKSILHVAVVNHRTLREDFDLLVSEVLKVGDELTKKLK